MRLIGLIRIIRRIGVLLPFWMLQAALSQAVTQVSREGQPLADQLVKIRKQVTSLEHGILENLDSEKNAQAQVRKIQKLLVLQQLERQLGKKRMDELDHTIKELELRRVKLRERIGFQQKSIRKFLMAIQKSNEESPREKADLSFLPEQEKVESPRRKTLAHLAERGMKDIEALQIDLSDAAHLEIQIQEEKHQLAYLFQDLREQEGILELNRQLQIDLLKKKQQERISRLQNYHKLKNAESQVERLINEFNARLELENVQETERKASKFSKAMAQGIFPQLKGRLLLPVEGGRVVSGFGRSLDPQSGLFIFKKGVEIEVEKKSPVRAISAGKIAFAGKLSNYGQVVIIDHGDHYYSLCAHLGSILKKTGESVNARDEIGQTDDLRAPLYFEIRSRNVAVNPLQWVSN